MNRTLIKLHKKASIVNNKKKYQGLKFSTVLDIMLEGWDMACQDFEKPEMGIKERGINNA